MVFTISNHRKSKEMSYGAMNVPMRRVGNQLYLGAFLQPSQSGLAVVKHAVHETSV
jgi:hypothetical protein